MALLTKAGAQGRRFLTAGPLRAWWALRSQKRRRCGLGTPAEPVITGLNLTESEGEPLYWFDVLIDFTFEQGRFPDGTIELYWSRDSQGWVENYVGAVSSNVRTFQHVRRSATLRMTMCLTGCVIGAALRSSGLSGRLTSGTTARRRTESVWLSR